MTQGAFGQYVIKNRSVESLLNAYEQVLRKFKFKTKESKWDGRTVHHKAVFGSGWDVWLTFKVFGRWGPLMESGNRYGAEAEIVQCGDDVILRLLIVPYMDNFDRPDVFMISQGLFEKINDDKWCVNKLNEIVSRLHYGGVPIYSQRPASSAASSVERRTSAFSVFSIFLGIISITTSPLVLSFFLGEAPAWSTLTVFGFLTVAAMLALIAFIFGIIAIALRDWKGWIGILIVIVSCFVVIILPILINQ